MLGKNGIKVFDHIFPQKLTLTFLGDHSLTPCIHIFTEIDKFLRIMARFSAFQPTVAPVDISIPRTSNPVTKKKHRFYRNKQRREN
jgi:hypothetical protein